MAFNGSGVYELPTTTVTPAVGSTTISSADFNTFTADLATALSLCLTEDGQNVPTANLPMATFRHTGVGDGQALTDYASVNQVVDNALTWGGASAVGTDAYAVSLTVNPGAYTAGMRVQFAPDVDNTGACTLDVNTLGAKNIKLINGSDPSNGDLDSNGIADLMYDGTNFVLLHSAALKRTDTSSQSASGSNIDFSSLPNGITRVIIGFSGISTNGTSTINVRIGADGGTFETTGYSSSAAYVASASQAYSSTTTSFVVTPGVNAADVISGEITLDRIDSATNTWVVSGSLGQTVTACTTMCTGIKSISSWLDEVRIFTSDTFDAGTFYLSYER